jgi:hypothetical protein
MHIVQCYIDWIIHIMFYVLFFMKDITFEEDDFVSRYGMKFQTIDETWLFWWNYGGKKGFGGKKRL